MSSAPLFYLKGLGRFFIFISTSLPCGAQKKNKSELVIDNSFPAGLETLRSSYSGMQKRNGYDGPSDRKNFIG